MKRLVWLLVLGVSACASGPTTSTDSESKPKKSDENIYRPSRFDLRY